MPLVMDGIPPWLAGKVQAPGAARRRTTRYPVSMPFICAWRSCDIRSDQDRTQSGAATTMNYKNEN